MNWPALHNMNTQLSKDSPMSRTSEEPKRVLILGLGNDILSDDAVGLLVARRLKHELSRFPGIAVLESSEMGLALLDFITGYSAVLIIDSIQTGQAAAGSVHELDGSHLKPGSGRTPHFLGIGETLALGRTMGLHMPAEVKLVAIEVEDALTVSAALTPALQAALPAITARAAALARSLAAS